MKNIVKYLYEALDLVIPGVAMMMEVWLTSISGLYSVPVYGAGTHGKDYGH
ncbi:MAG: hypothetical protein JSS96_11730 [Bacteroidetes bacterium]|nr:hypothetical protein [Bacteroidota bacterium]